MTDVAGPLSASKRLALSGLLAAISVLAGLDAAMDWSAGGSIAHIATEIMVAILAAIGVASLSLRYAQVRSDLQVARRSLEGAHAEAEVWRRRNEEVLRGLAAAIDGQLDGWRLTAAEKEVAFLLLKGLSFKEIASVRGTGERTVRQQALAVYAKSGLGGRAELAAFFLEDLLLPPR